MRKLISIFLCLCLIACIVPAVAEYTLHAIDSTEFPLYGAVASVEEMGTLKLYFLNGVNDLPYIELHDWLALAIKCFREDDTTEEGAYNLTLETAGPSACFTRETQYSLVIDFNANTFRFPDYNLFMKNPTMSTPLDFTSRKCYNKDGEPSLMKKNEEFTFDRYGSEMVINFGDYGIDLIWQDGMYLVPLQTMADFLLSPATGLSLFFNGKSVILSSKTDSCTDLYFAGETGKRSPELAEYGYNELCVMLDCLYGQKETHEIASFNEFFTQIGFDRALKDTDPLIADKAMVLLIKKYFDEGHCGFDGYSYLSGPTDFQPEYGPSMEGYIEQYKKYLLARKAAFPDGVPAYYEVGNTAYITFDQFDMKSATYDDYYGYENKQDIPFGDDDTIALIIKAHEQITRENSPIENVVIDLSCNLGGAVDTAAYMLAWCLGKANISIKDNFTGAMATTEYWADVNLDRKFDEKDTITDKNIYCLISPVSFSCGNLVPNVFKQSGMVTLLGRTSGGGSCIVQFISTAWGTSFHMSASRRMSFLKNGALYDIDRGADPDYTLSRPEKYYDREWLTEFINSLP